MVMISAKIIARYSKRRLLIIWDVDAYCNAHYSDLFENGYVEITDAFSVNKCKTYVYMDPVSRYTKLNLDADRDICVTSAYLLRSNHVDVISTHSIRYKQELRNMYDYIHADIKDIVSTFRIPPNSIGLHVESSTSKDTDALDVFGIPGVTKNVDVNEKIIEPRSGCNLMKFDKILNYWNKKVRGRMKIKLSKLTTVVIASDWRLNVTSIRSMQVIFLPNPSECYTLKYSDAKCLRYALASVFLLSKTKFFVGSNLSAFSKITKDISNKTRHFFDCERSKYLFLKNARITDHQQIDRRNYNTVTDHSSLGLIIPYIDEQIQRLQKMLSRWAENSYMPCHIGESEISVTVYFYHPGFSSNSKLQINQVWDSLPNVTRNCFGGGMSFLHAKLSNSIANRHPDGPCAQFYKLFNILHDVDFAFIMEPDALPIQRGWASRILLEAQHDDFWLKGSVSHCNGLYGKIQQRHDLHYNGNGLFRIGNSDFNAFIAKVRDFYPAFTVPGLSVDGCATGKAFEGGHDHAIYQFLHHPLNFNYARSVLHKFSYTEVILNLCEEEYDENQIISRNKDTMIVHSKGQLFSKEEKIVRQLYWNISLSIPDKKSMKSMVDIMENELNGISVVKDKLCTQLSYPYGTHRSKLCTNHCHETNWAFDQTSLLKANAVCRDAFERVWWELRIPTTSAYFWSSDFHIGPIKCLKPLLTGLNAIVHAEIDFSNCIHDHDMCKKRLKVLEFDNWRGFGLEPCPNTLRQRFYNAYHLDEEFRRVDVFICSHPAANCELYMPFDRTIVVYATTRLEFGRHDAHIEWRKPEISEKSPKRWVEWVSNLKLIASKSQNVIAANNLFDVHYIKYHTGLDAVYLPSWCGGDITYKPDFTRPVLLGPYRDNLDYPRFDDMASWKHPILHGLKLKLKKSYEGKWWFQKKGFDIKRLHEIYNDNYKWEEVVKHPAIIFIPYQVSTISFFEFYRANIPVFAPSLDLLMYWTQKYGIMWERIYGTPERQPHDHWDSEPNGPNGNDSLRYWLKLSDFYVFPHVQLFDSWDHLFELFNTLDLNSISARMNNYNQKEKRKIENTWSEIINAAIARRSNTIDRHDLIPRSYDEVMNRIWGSYNSKIDPPARVKEGGSKCKVDEETSEDIGHAFKLCRSLQVPKRNNIENLVDMLFSRIHGQNPTARERHYYSMLLTNQPLQLKEISKKMCNSQVNLSNSSQRCNWTALVSENYLINWIKGCEVIARAK